jgi:lipopolysaccharide transport system permease protein
MKPTAEFRNTTVRLVGRTLSVRGEIANRTRTDWNCADGWSTGFHLFDAPSGTLVVDGERAPLDLPAGGDRHFETQVAIPPEPGEYSIYVSVMREHVAWFYDRGWRFILIDVSVDENGTASLRRWRVANKGAVRRRRLMRDIAGALTLPVQIPWRNRNLIRTLVRRDIMSRYAGSAGGALWAVLNPLLITLTYFFIFGVVMHARVPGDPSATGFAFYFLAGMMPWLAFSDAIARAPGILIEHRNFIRKLVFPVETLPVNLVVTGLVTEFFGIAIFLVGSYVVRGHIAATLLYLPLVAIPQVLLTAGICWFLAALGVFVRDLAQINGYVLTIWFFVTPIGYPESQLASLSPGAARLMALNPMYVLVRNYRRILLESVAPDWRGLAWTTLAAVFVFLAGHAWFRKLRRSFADLI